MTTPLYSAPFLSAPIEADIDVPGSKSQTNRALVLAALSDGPSTLHQPLISRDTRLMAAALANLGHRIDVDGDRWHVTPGTASGDISVDCGLAGTVMRFVPPVAALTPARTRFDGDPRARERPMGATISSLRGLGVQVDDDGRGALPFTVHGQQTRQGGQLEVDASGSSQFVSALLLVAPRLKDGLILTHSGATLPSLPHIDMTLTELRRHGIEVTAGDASWTVTAGPVHAVDVVIEPDLSNAGVFLAAALVTAGRVRVRHWPAQTDQAGDAWREIVTAFGGSWVRDGDDLVFSGPAELRSVDLDLHDVGELTPVVAALAALAPGRSQLRGIAHLRGHETDRLKALATELTALGAPTDDLPDGLVIDGGHVHAGTFASYDDHRMAHAGVVLGLAVDGVKVENIDTTAKTLPGFADIWTDWVRTGDTRRT